MAQADNLCDRNDYINPKHDETKSNNENKKEVRFVDDEEIKGHFRDVDEVDHAVPKVKKVHILKNRSSSEQSFLLRSNSFKERMFGRHDSLESLHKQSDNLNNNNPKNKNFNDNDENEKKSDEKSEKCNGTFKKNANVYSVFQAKTLSERRKTLPNLQKSLAAKANDRYHRSYSDPKEDTLVPIKELRAKALRRLSRGIGRLLRRSSSINISEPDPIYKVAYLGNVLTGWAKGEGCVDKPLATLWRNYNQSSKPDVVMKLSITNSGLKGFTKEHGLTEYWSHRITYCASPPHYPKIFCWVYRHEGRKLKHELRCHAVLCSKESVSQKITEELQLKLQQALSEFKRDKISRQNARLSLANAVYDNPSMPRRKILLSVGGNNYRPPLERSKSAPKLMAIEELCSEEDEEEERTSNDNCHTYCNTWTKSKSPQRVSYNIDELYPSYTLGRRRSDRFKSPRKISLPEKITESEFKPLDKSKSLEDPPLSEIDDPIDQDDKMNSTVSFSEEILSLLIQESKRLNIDFKPSSQEIDINVESESFNNRTPVKEKEATDSDGNLQIESCSKHSSDDDSNNEFNNHTKETTVKAPVGLLEHLCSQSNYLVLDSDEGSISSGCETASTVTSSDIEMTSLSSQYGPNNYNKKTRVIDDTNNDNIKVSVLQRVQSFEQLCSSNGKASPEHTPRRYSSFKTTSYSERLEPKIHLKDDELSDKSNDSISPCNDVNLIPLGEKVVYTNDRFRRRLTYPPVKILVDITDPRIQKLNSTTIGSFDNYSSSGDDSENVAICDNDSACSDESGYSELLESGYLRDGIVGNTVMV